MTSNQSSSRFAQVHDQTSVSPDLLAFFLIFTVTIVTYLGLGSHSFVDFDDLRIIVNRIDTYDGLTLDNVLTIIFRDHPREEPLIMRDISYLINAEIFGPLNPQGYLTGNLLLHMLASFLTYRLFLALYPGKYWTATFTALLFALHPIHVESVAWISSRKDTLYSCFFLLAFALYRGFLASSKRKPLIGSYLLFVCALLSKSAAIAFLPLIVCYRLQLCPEKRWRADEFFFIGVTALSTLLFVLWYHWELAAFGVFTNHGVPLLKEDPGQWFLLNTEVITFYLMKLAYPLNLSTFYNVPRPSRLFQEIPFLGISLVITAGATFSAIKLWRRPDKRLLFLLSWFIITLTPYLNLAGVNIFVADRYCYLTTFAVCAAIALALDTLYNRSLNSNTPRYHSLHHTIIATAILLCTALSIISIDTIKVWENTETLWTNALRVAPLRSNTYLGLAKSLLSTFEDNPNANESQTTLHKAKKVALASYALYCKNDRCPPSMAGILLILGKINYYEGDMTAAARYLKNVVTFDAKNLAALHAYSYVLINQGRYGEAERMIKEIEHSADPEKNRRMLADIHNQLRPLLVAKQKTTPPPATIQDL
jgi:4-amino-4-deoxy-L-arabinose transferase-like glycosyltransferase